MDLALLQKTIMIVTCPVSDFQYVGGRGERGRFVAAGGAPEEEALLLLLLTEPSLGFVLALAGANINANVKGKPGAGLAFPKGEQMSSLGQT